MSTSTTELEHTRDEQATAARLTPEEARLSDLIAETMAGTMIDRAAVFGACGIDHLANAGWTAAEIVEYEADARRIAQRQSVRDVNDDMIEAALPQAGLPQTEAA